MTINYDALNAARAASYAQAEAKAPQGIQETAYRAINSLFSKVSKAVSPFFAHLKETSLNAKESIKDLSYRAVEWIKDYPNSRKYALIGDIAGFSLSLIGGMTATLMPLMGMGLVVPIAAGTVLFTTGLGILLHSSSKGHGL